MEFQNQDAAADIQAFLDALPFVRSAEASLISVEPGSAIMEAPLIAAHEAAPGTFSASAIGAIGDMASICSILSCLPKGWATATLDFTIKMCGPARGTLARATGQVLQNGRTTSVARADVYMVNEGQQVLCGTVLVTGRNFEVKS